MSSSAPSLAYTVAVSHTLEIGPAATPGWVTFPRFNGQLYAGRRVSMVMWFDEGTQVTLPTVSSSPGYVHHSRSTHCAGHRPCSDLPRVFLLPAYRRCALATSWAPAKAQLRKARVSLPLVANLSSRPVVRVCSACDSRYRQTKYVTCSLGSSAPPWRLLSSLATPPSCGSTIARVGIPQAQRWHRMRSHPPLHC